MRKVNWIGLLSAGSMFLILCLSLAHRAPWWRLEVADNLGYVNVSPLDFEVEIMGNAVNVPLLVFATFGSKISWFVVASAMLAYSLDLSPKHSEKLLDFGYRKPTYYVVGTLLVGLVGSGIVGSFLSMELPFIGVSTVTFGFEGGMVTIPLKGSLTWVFGVAVGCAALSIGARLYQRRLRRGQPTSVGIEEGAIF